MVMKAYVDMFEVYPYLPPEKLRKTWKNLRIISSLKLPYRLGLLII